MRKLKNVIFLISINLMVIFCFLAFATCVIALLPEIAKASIDMILGILLGKILLKLNKIVIDDIRNENKIQRRYEKYGISRNNNSK